MFSPYIALYYCHGAYFMALSIDKPRLYKIQYYCNEMSVQNTTHNNHVTHTWHKKWISDVWSSGRRFKQQDITCHFNPSPSKCALTYRCSHLKILPLNLSLNWKLTKPTTWFDSWVSTSFEQVVLVLHQWPGRTRYISVIAAGWFCEKSGWIGKVEDVKPVPLKHKRVSTGNHFEEEDFYPDELWNKRVLSGLIHLGPDIIWF
jgi:hypothetical protein